MSVNIIQNSSVLLDKDYSSVDNAIAVSQRDISDFIQREEIQLFTLLDFNLIVHSGLDILRGILKLTCTEIDFENLNKIIS
jgi:hypothetical protein